MKQQSTFAMTKQLRKQELISAMTKQSRKQESISAMAKQLRKQQSTSKMTKQLRKQLQSLAEPSYKNFQEALIPGCTNMLGVRIPAIRKLAKETKKSSFLPVNKLLASMNEVVSYLHESDELYYEEYILKALLIGELGNLRTGASETGAWSELVFNEIRLFIPKITNWGICDTFCAALKIARKEPERMWSFLEPYIRSDGVYDIRFAVVMYLDYYIDSEHLPLLFERFENIRNTDYYVRMAVAWALSMCFVRFPKETAAFLNRRTIDEDTYKKTLQKIRDSRQVPKEARRLLKNKEKGVSKYSL